jgi:uncharacterized protein with von Willebrand factor type A (vWA) domain
VTVAMPPAVVPAPRGGEVRVLTFVERLTGRLRDRGVRVGTGEVLAAHRALAAVDAADPVQARAALRTTLCHRRSDLAAFDAAWDLGLRPAELTRVEAEITTEPGETEASPVTQATSEAEEAPVPVPAAWSDVELLRDRDFSILAPEEVAVVERAVRRLRVAGPWRRSRRTRPTRRGDRLDVPATLRAHVRSGGLDRRFRTPTRVQRPLVLLVDVSGSMAPYARMFLTAMQATIRSRPHVEAFAFGTRLTRLTLELRRLDVDVAAAAAQDWAGGTRIGDALATLNRQHGRRLGRGAVVVVLSDGWDRGDPELLADEMARLRRSAHRVVWVNPLSARPNFEPLTRGLIAALPHTDVVASAHSQRALGALATTLEEMP